MNIIEALKSGRPYKRIDILGRPWIAAYPASQCFSTEEILADDWIIEEPSVNITRAQLEAAVYAYGDKAHPDIYDHAGGIFEGIAKELGL